MTSLDKILAILSVCILLQLTSSTAPPKPEFVDSLQSFSSNLFTELFKSNGDKNIIYSPFSIQTCLAMVGMGAAGNTATELNHILGFGGQTDDSIADNYHSMLAKYESDNILSIANKVYVMKGYELQDKFKELLSQKFFSSAENVDFAQSEQAANQINSWVQSKTNQQITELVTADDLDAETLSFLLSAIHFKGEWEFAFNSSKTKEEDFHVNKDKTVKVQMMHNTDYFDIRTESAIDAYVVRLPYRNSDLSMVLVWPAIRDGFANTMKKLESFQLHSLKDKFVKRSVSLGLPIFKATLDMDLSETLQKLGVHDIFSKSADLSKMFKSSTGGYISKVFHKAVIEVNERGTEAAAVTAARPMSRLAPMPFILNGPFFYAIVNEDFIPLFQGTIVDF